jgi:hypothetical protein
MCFAFVAFSEVKKSAVTFGSMCQLKSSNRWRSFMGSSAKIARSMRGSPQCRSIFPRYAGGVISDHIGGGATDDIRLPKVEAHAEIIGDIFVGVVDNYVVEGEIDGGIRKRRGPLAETVRAFDGAVDDR